MKTQKISFSKLIFAFLCFLVLTGVGTAAQAANITGSISDGLSVYTSGNINIGAFTDQAGTTQVAGPVTITSLTDYTLPVGDEYDGMQLWVKARWDADASGTKNGGDVVGGSSTPITFNKSTGNSGVNITLGGVLISGVIQVGNSGYSSPAHPNIYIGASDGSGAFVSETMVSALGTKYILSVPGSYLGQQLKIIAIWDADGSTDPFTGPFPPIPTPGDWWGKYSPNPTLQVGTNSTINIPLTSEFFTISGTVTRAEGGALIPYLEVNVRKDNPCEGEQPVAWAQTDSIGNYSLTLPGGFEYFLFVNPALMDPSPDLAPEWYTSTSGTFYCAEAEGIVLTENTYGKNFALENGGTITGTVKDNIGNMLSGVTVETYNDALGGGWQQASTNTSGYFAFSNLAPGPWEIRIQMDPVATNYVDFIRDYWLDTSENRDIGIVSLQQGALVTGTFKDSAANPIPYLEYWYGGKFEIGWSQAAGDGTFQFRLPLGTYTLNLDPQDSGYTMLPQDIEVTDVGTPISLGDLTAYDNTTGDHILGTVTDGALHNGQFQVVSFLSSQPFTPDKFGGLGLLGGGQPAFPGDGSYSMFIPPDQTVNIILALFVQNEKSLESMTVVSTPIVGLNLSLDPDGIVTGQNFVYDNAGYTIDGYVKSSSAPAPPFKASVLLYKQPGDQFTGFADSDETGYYKFYNVPAGDYKIAVTHPRYPDETAWSSQFTVSADTTVQDITMGGGPVSGDELAIDFGNLGIWHYNAGAWNQISAAGAEFMLSGGDVFVGDFGAAGLWQLQGTTWTQLSAADPDNNGNAMIHYGTGGIIDFGGLGLWFYDGAGNWSQFSTLSTDFMTVYNNNVFVGDFGASGVWQFDGTNWSQISTANPDNNGNAMIAYGSGILIDFGGLGLWYYDGTNWSQFSALSTQFMTVYNNNLFVGDFGASGVWQFDGTNWSQISTANPDNNGNAMIAYGSGIVIDFGAAGLWYYDGTNWSQFSALSTEFMTVYNNNVFVGDFGAAGVWQFDGTNWSQISTANPDNNGNAFVAVNLVN